MGVIPPFIYKYSRATFCTLFRKMYVLTLPALQDNYMYILVDDNTKQCAVVDPVEPRTIMDAMKANNLRLTSVLTTHHHWDHASGNNSLVEMLKKEKINVNVYGGSSKVDALTNKVKTGDTISIGEHIKIYCLATPCHTQDHICYHATEEGKPKNEGLVFTGDTLFLGGCGRFFEGSPEEMYNSLVNVLGKLSPDTKVYCGHEYTLKNLQFAITVDPNNAELQLRLKKCTDLRNSGLKTVPGSIAEELATNPFMRVSEPALRMHTKCDSPVGVIKALRREKDNF